MSLGRSLGHYLHASSPRRNAEVHGLRCGVADDAGLLFEAGLVRLDVRQLAGGWVKLHSYNLVRLELEIGTLAIVLVD